MKLLIQELQKHFSVDIWEPKERKGDMTSNAILYAIEFSNYLIDKNYDAIIIRGDRYEMLGLSMVAVYRGFKIIHIEGGDESGVIDNKVRHAITHLSDYYFCTNKESHRRLINMGVPIESVFNFGSLDVEFADKVKPKKSIKEPYILVAYHCIPGEDVNELEEALKMLKNCAIIKVGSNTDYGRKYGNEEFPPEEFINTLRFAKCAVGNSSALLKEASILGTPVVLVGNRQQNRLMPRNVVQVPCKKENIQMAILYQMQHKREKDLLYYQANTSKKICRQMEKYLQA